jgi:acyl-CoA thioester hydrolase
MHIFSRQITVSQSDLDDLEHVNNVRYVQWIQDISKEHWVHKAPKQIQDSVFWVVMTHHIQYKAPALLNDPITISTYIKETKGAKSIRVVEMKHSETNTVFVRSTTEWCLLNKENLKPMRVSDQIQDIFN